MDAKVTARFFIREALGLVVLGVALFWSAGRLDWWPGWACWAVTVAWILATAFVILRLHPQLIAERLGPRRGAKRWDTAIIFTLGITQLLRYILAGFDERYGRTGGFPLVAQLSALVICVLGYAIVVWATASNPFFSQIVRVQIERGHIVAADGPYCYVRHPAYVGAILFEIAVSVLLASWLALLVSALNVILLIIRTALEDRTLLSELVGYVPYSRQVPYRLVPAIW